MQQWHKMVVINLLMLSFFGYLGYRHTLPQPGVLRVEAQNDGGITEANPIKNWTSNEYITYTDLNNNFNHLHANLGHGHGPIITANDISANAGIRPEQTTFGLAISKNLKFVGTFKQNPDGGANYITLNSSGTLAVTVTALPSNTGVTIAGAASSSLLADAGTQIYSIFYKTVGLTLADATLCLDQGTPSILSAPFSVVTDCFDFTDTTWPLTMKNPSGISVEVYSNATNP